MVDTVSDAIDVFVVKVVLLVSKGSVDTAEGSVPVTVSDDFAVEILSLVEVFFSKFSIFFEISGMSVSRCFAW
jgi:hypothetical protein